MLLLGFAGHNLYRYNWLWLAGFEVIAVRCLRVQAAGVRARVRFSPRPAWRPAAA